MTVLAGVFSALRGWLGRGAGTHVDRRRAYRAFAASATELAALVASAAGRAGARWSAHQGLR